MLFVRLPILVAQ